MSQATILIVEDEAIVAADVACKLKQLGYAVVGIAARGDEAVALACSLHPHLVLMDISLVGPMDGITTAEAIRRERDTPVVYLTAHSDPVTLARAKLSGPIGYILKPFDERELATQIELALYKHQTDRQLRQQHEWLHVTLTSIADAVIATDATGQIAFVNPVAQTLTGWAVDEAVGQPIQRMLHLLNEQTGEPLEEPVTRILREGHAVALANHTALLTKDGRKVPIEDSAALIRDAADHVIGAVLVFHDVTEKRRAEERRRLVADITAQLLESDQPQRIIEAICHRVMDHLGCHVFLNFLADEQIGHLQLDSCTGIPAETAQYIESLDYCVAMCGHMTHDDCRSVVENVQATADARSELLRSFGIQAYACHPITNQGQIIGALSFGARDRATFTEDDLGLMKVVADHVANALQRIRMLESLERHARAAEAASEAKSQFLANMSHELRTPMNAILGMIDVALPKVTDPTVQDCLQTAKGSADILLTLLNDLLDSARIESGKLALEAAPFSLRKMLDEITRILSLRASEKGLLFYCHLPEKMPDALVGDRMRLQQILLNLAGNAIKFTERGTVEINLRALPAEDGDTCLEFAVTDTGIGIPPIALTRLFQPFAQADASTARRFGGSGLGLSISKSLVEMMGGQICVESRVGKGSAFYFTVRLALSKELRAEIPPPVDVPPAAHTSLRILLVEDNLANRKLARYILHDRGHVVECVGDGQAAIDLTEQNCYDVILMDVQMPGVDGLAATTAIRKRESGGGSHVPGGHVPIIAMTAFAMKGDRERCLAAGMDDYLSKPLNAQEMIRVVESLARGELPRPLAAAEAPGLPDAVQSAPVVIFNFEEALTRCFQSENRLREMIQYFVEEVDSVITQMRSALENGDLMKVGLLGHQFKGTLVYLGAQPATEAALHVERFCKSSDATPTDAKEAINALQQACEILKTTLAKHPLMDGMRSRSM